MGCCAALLAEDPPLPAGREGRSGDRRDPADQRDELRRRRLDLDPASGDSTARRDGNRPRCRPVVGANRRVRRRGRNRRGVARSSGRTAVSGAEVEPAEASPGRWDEPPCPAPRSEPAEASPGRRRTAVSGADVGTGRGVARSSGRTTVSGADVGMGSGVARSSRDEPPYPGLLKSGLRRRLAVRMRHCGAGDRDGHRPEVARPSGRDWSPQAQRSTTGRTRSRSAARPQHRSPSHLPRWRRRARPIREARAPTSDAGEAASSAAASNAIGTDSSSVEASNAWRSSSVNSTKSVLFLVALRAADHVEGDSPSHRRRRGPP